MKVWFAVTVLKWVRESKGELELPSVTLEEEVKQPRREPEED